MSCPCSFMARMIRLLVNSFNFFYEPTLKLTRILYRFLLNEPTPILTRESARSERTISQLDLRARAVVWRAVAGFD